MHQVIGVARARERPHRILVRMARIVVRLGTYASQIADDVIQDTIVVEAMLLATVCVQGGIIVLGTVLQELLVMLGPTQRKEELQVSLYPDSFQCFSLDRESMTLILACQSIRVSFVAPSVGIE